MLKYALNNCKILQRSLIPKISAGSNVKLSTKASDFFEEQLRRLQEEKVSEPTNSLELIFAHVLKKKLLREVRGDNLQKIELTKDERQEILDKTLLRLSNVPVQYILKAWEFRDLELLMKIPVFICRPETEEIIELITQQLDRNQDYKILEIGCGCGAISLALLNELPNVQKIIAIDQSRQACELTLENAKNLGFSERIQIFKHKIDSDDLPEKIAYHQQFDVIVSNPPYVPNKDLMKLDPEIYLYEDLHALDGGVDGLDVIKLILPLAGKYLKKGGHLWLEIDSRHAEIIQKIVENNCDDWRLKFVASYKDIFKKDRFVEIEKL